MTVLEWFKVQTVVRDNHVAKLETAVMKSNNTPVANDGIVNSEQIATQDPVESVLNQQPSIPVTEPIAPAETHQPDPTPLQDAEQQTNTVTYLQIEEESNSDDMNW